MTTRPATVLLVDDEEDVRMLTRQVLESNGYTVLEAHDGQNALALLKLCVPDVIITELMMPVMDGFEFMSRYLKQPKPAPVLAVSSYEGYLSKAQESGAVASLAKPFTADELLRNVDALLSGTTPQSTHRRYDGPDEVHRVAAVLEMRFAQLQPSEALRRFVQRTAAIFNVPICQVSIVDKDLQYSHASCGVAEGILAANPRNLAFCSHAVVNRSALVVQDAFSNPFFKDNPLIRSQGLRFYAGVPLITRLGVAVGTLCLMDYKEHAFSHFDLELLSLLARRVLAEFDMVEHRRRPAEPECTFPNLAELDPELGILGRYLFMDVVKLEAARCLEKKEPLALFIIHSPAHALPERVRLLEAFFPRAHFGRLGSARLGMVIPGMPASHAKQIIQKHLGPSDFITTSELSSLVAPGAAEAVMSAMEAPMGGAGLTHA